MIPSWKLILLLIVYDAYATTTTNNNNIANSNSNSNGGDGDDDRKPAELVLAEFWKGRSRNQLFNRTLVDSDRHLRHISMALRNWSVVGGNGSFRLELNEMLIWLSLQVVNVTDDQQSSTISSAATEFQNTATTVEHCYYQQKPNIRGKHGTVALSTCNGTIRGLIHQSNGWYTIEPSGTKPAGNQLEIKRLVGRPPANCGQQSVWFGSRLKKLNVNQLPDNADQLAVDRFRSLTTIPLLLRLARWAYSKENLNGILSVINVADGRLKPVGLTLTVGRIELISSDQRQSVLSDWDLKWAVRHELASLVQRRNGTGPIRRDVVFRLVSGPAGSDDVGFGLAIPNSLCTGRSVGVMSWPWTRKAGPQPLTAEQIWLLAGRLTHLLLHMSGIGDGDCLEQLATDVSSAELPNCVAFGLRMQHARRLACFDGASSDGSAAAAIRWTCGDGRVDDSEECDCDRSRFTPAECQKRQPCCDHQSCLLMRGAVCVGDEDCCDAATCHYRPAGHVCRPSASDCDLTERCTGQQRTCPDDQFKQDGLPCSSTPGGSLSGYCWFGQCPTLREQCRRLWGQTADVAASACYDQLFEPTADQTRCGFDTKRLTFTACTHLDAFCGPLQCIGGDLTPSGGQRATFYPTETDELVPARNSASLTTVMAPFSADNRQELVCNSVRTRTHAWDVSDGTKCSDDHICINYRCVPIKSLVLAENRAGIADKLGRPVSILPCPKDRYNRTCGSNGICSNAGLCYCDRPWTGQVCQTRLAVGWTEGNRANSSAGLGYGLGAERRDGDVRVADGQLTTVAGESELKSKWDLSTRWLMVIIGSVVVLIVSIMVAVLFCYRRRTPIQNRSPWNRGKWLKRNVSSTERRGSHGTVEKGSAMALAAVSSLEPAGNAADSLHRHYANTYHSAGANDDVDDTNLSTDAHRLLDHGFADCPECGNDDEELCEACIFREQQLNDMALENGASKSIKFVGPMPSYREDKVLQIVEARKQREQERKASKKKWRKQLGFGVSQSPRNSQTEETPLDGDQLNYDDDDETPDGGCSTDDGDKVILPAPPERGILRNRVTSADEPGDSSPNMHLSVSQQQLPEPANSNQMMSVPPDLVIFEAAHHVQQQLPYSQPYHGHNDLPNDLDDKSELGPAGDAGTIEEFNAYTSEPMAPCSASAIYYAQDPQSGLIYALSAATSATYPLSVPTSMEPSHGAVVLPVIQEESSTLSPYSVASPPAIDQYNAQLLSSPTSGGDVLYYLPSSQPVDVIAPTMTSSDSFTHNQTAPTSTASGAKRLENIEQVFDEIDRQTLGKRLAGHDDRLSDVEADGAGQVLPPPPQLPVSSAFRPVEPASNDAIHPSNLTVDQPAPAASRPPVPPRSFPPNRPPTSKHTPVARVSPHVERRPFVANSATALAQSNGAGTPQLRNFNSTSACYSPKKRNSYAIATAKLFDPFSGSDSNTPSNESS